MTKVNDLLESEETTTKKLSPKVRTFLFALQISFIVALLVLWFFVESIRTSKNLWVLFFYSFPTGFLVGVVPHEPVLLYFSKFYLPLTVALVAIAGTTITELLNYSVFKYVMDLNVFKNLSQKKTVVKLVNLFKKSPFVALLVAGFTPVPFYPFRFLVVVAKYPKWKYILAVILSRTPRYYLLAIFGYSLKVPDYLLISLFALLVLLPYFPLLKNLIKKLFKKNVS